MGICDLKWTARWGLFSWKNGDPGGIRTLGHLIKSQVLYQLSYRIKKRAPLYQFHQAKTSMDSRTP